MGIKTIHCAICNQETTKRQSLLVEPYGRICRIHPEVEQHKEKLASIARKAAEDKRFVEATRSLQTIVVAEQIRMVAFMNAVSLEFAMLSLLWKLPKDFCAEVRRIVTEKGPLSEDEFQQALLTACVLKRKVLEA